MTGFKSMLLTILAAFVGLSQNVSAESLTKIHFSPAFTISVPTQSLDGATLFSSEGPAIKFSNNRYMAGSIVTRERDGLGPTFDLADYPLYLFGWKETTELPAEEAEVFERINEEWRAILDGPVFDSVKLPGATAYTACSHRCEVLVVKDSESGQILHMTSQGFSQVELITLLQGASDATK